MIANINNFLLLNTICRKVYIYLVFLVCRCSCYNIHLPFNRFSLCIYISNIEINTTGDSLEIKLNNFLLKIVIYLSWQIPKSGIDMANILFVFILSLLPFLCSRMCSEIGNRKLENDKEYLNSNKSKCLHFYTSDAVCFI